MKSKHLSSLFQWCIIIFTAIVVGQALYDNWREVQSLELDKETWWYVIVAVAVSILSHCWSGVVWGEILRNLQYPVPWRWATIIFIKTEIAKYLPGDIWQTYGRLVAARKLGIPVTVAFASVLLQSVYIAAAGMIFGLLIAADPTLQRLCSLGLACILVSVHPFVFDRVFSWIEQLPNALMLQRIFNKLARSQWTRPRMQSYPWRVILGQCLFLALRSVGFLLTVAIFTPVRPVAIIPLASGFSLAWALGIVSPISGGVGVFEATALGLLDRVVEPSVVLGAVIVYRLIALLTEAIGAGLGWLLGRNEDASEV